MIPRRVILNDTMQDQHEPITIVQLLDFRKASKLQLAQRILETLSPIGSEQAPELKATLLPDLGCAVVTVSAGSLMAGDMRLFYTVSHLADAFTIETVEENKVSFSLVFHTDP